MFKTQYIFSRCCSTGKYIYINVLSSNNVTVTIVLVSGIPGSNSMACVDSPHLYGEILEYFDITHLCKYIIFLVILSFIFSCFKQIRILKTLLSVINEEEEPTICCLVFYYIYDRLNIFRADYAHHQELTNIYLITTWTVWFLGSAFSPDT
jgi:hypothetical protein